MTKICPLLGGTEKVNKQVIGITAYLKDTQRHNKACVWSTQPLKIKFVQGIQKELEWCEKGSVLLSEQKQQKNKNKIKENWLITLEKKRDFLRRNTEIV